MSAPDRADPELARPLPNLPRTLGFTLGMAFGSYPGLAVGTFLLVPIGWLPASLSALWLKFLVDGAIARDATELGLAAAALVGTQVITWAAGAFGQRVLATFKERAGIVIERRIVEVSAGLRGLAHLERPDYLDRLDPLRKEAWIVHWTLEAFAQTIGAVIRLALTIGLLCSVDPVLVLLPLLGIPAVFAARRGALREQRAQEATAENRRLQRHLVGLASRASQGKEIRVFGLADDVVRRSRAAFELEHRLRGRAAWRSAIGKALGTLLVTLGFVAAIALVGYRVVTGAASVGDLALTLVLAQTMSGNLSMVVEMIEWLVANLGYGARLLWLVDLEREEAGALALASSRARVGSGDGAAAAAVVPARIEHALELREVSFSYPGTDRLVLDRVSLRLPAGSVVALVGENGAGKTTIAKLLTRMYAPTAGALELDGTDLEAYDIDEWRRRCTAAFQDHARLEFALGRAITLGDLERLDDPATARAGLRAAGGTDLLSTLPAGLDTQLGGTWPHGRELSGGQWQKVALARGLVRTDPLLTILDEPTAALDARTEDALFTRYAEAARSGRDTGGVTLLVSHRFSTVRTADLIVVLAHGRVVELGTHDALISLGGRYAELYDLQARGYR